MGAIQDWLTAIFLEEFARNVEGKLFKPKYRKMDSTFLSSLSPKPNIKQHKRLIKNFR